MTQRRRLDAYLVDRAVATGVELRDGTAVSEIRQDGVDENHARVVIGADGANGISRRSLDTQRWNAVALEGNIVVANASIEHYAERLVLEFGTVRGGYGWIFPKGDHVNVGVGGNGEEASKLRAELHRMCEAYGIDPEAATETRGYRLPLRRSKT